MIHRKIHVYQTSKGKSNSIGNMYKNLKISRKNTTDKKNSNIIQSIVNDSITYN